MTLPVYFLSLCHTGLMWERLWRGPFDPLCVLWMRSRT
jgi:hypothetical protein